MTVADQIDGVYGDLDKKQLDEPKLKKTSNQRKGQMHLLKSQKINKVFRSKTGSLVKVTQGKINEALQASKYMNQIRLYKDHADYKKTVVMGVVWRLAIAALMFCLIIFMQFWIRIQHTGYAVESLEEDVSFKLVFNKLNRGDIS